MRRRPAPLDSHSRILTNRKNRIDQIPPYPLRFEPIYQYRLWGARRLAGILSAPLPGDGPIGEAWILSDREDHPSRVAGGPLKGKTIKELIDQWPRQIMGELAGHFSRFPLLLKFLDVKEALSVQVHPSDAHVDLIPAGETGKTEAWVVLEANAGSRIYAGVKRGATPDDLGSGIESGKIEEFLSYFTPKAGDAVLVRAGTVHSLRDVVVFEVQENSDVTFRLYDWNHVDPQTGQHRPLQVEQALACVDYTQVAIAPLQPPIHCDHFTVWRINGEAPFSAGKQGVPRVLVCIVGEGQLEHSGVDYAFGKGDVMLLPAAVGACRCRPHGEASLLEIALPEGSGIS